MVHTSGHDHSATRQVSGESTQSLPVEGDDSAAAILEESSGASGMLFTVRAESTPRPPAPPEHLSSFKTAGNQPVTGLEDMSMEDFLNEGGVQEEDDDDAVISSSESSQEDA